MNTREDIVFWADSLIRHQGFNGFSYTDIAEHLDIRNAAVHYYFPAKADLGVEVIHREWLRIREDRQRHRDDSGDEQLKILVLFFYHRYLQNEVCLNGALIPDYYTFTPQMKEELKRMSEETLHWAADCLGRGREEGSLQFSGTPEDRALLLLSTLSSSLLLTRVSGPEAFRRALDQLLSDMRVSWRTDDLGKTGQGPDGDGR